PARAPRGALPGRSSSLVRMVSPPAVTAVPLAGALPIWHTLPFLSTCVIYASVSHETTSLSEPPGPARAVRSPGRPPPVHPRRVRQRQRRGHRRGGRHSGADPL